MRQRQSVSAAYPTKAEEFGASAEPPREGVTASTHDPSPQRGWRRKLRILCNWATPTTPILPTQRATSPSRGVVSPLEATDLLR